MYTPVLPDKRDTITIVSEAEPGFDLRGIESEVRAKDSRANKVNRASTMVWRPARIDSSFRVSEATLRRGPLSIVNECEIEAAVVIHWVAGVARRCWHLASYSLGIWRGQCH